MTIRVQQNVLQFDVTVNYSELKKKCISIVTIWSQIICDHLTASVTRLHACTKTVIGKGKDVRGLKTVTFIPCRMTKLLWYEHKTLQYDKLNLGQVIKCTVSVDLHAPHQALFGSRQQVNIKLTLWRCSIAIIISPIYILTSSSVNFSLWYRWVKSSPPFT